MHQFRTLKKSENLHINLVNGKIFADCIYCSISFYCTLSICYKKKKNVFFITGVCKFFSYVVVFSHYFVAIMESN